MDDVRNAYRILVAKPKNTSHLEEIIVDGENISIDN
jgi:hypothetical protein